MKRKSMNLGSGKCEIYKDLLRIAAAARREGFLRRFQGDLIRHDKRELKNYCGPYMWAVAKDATYLVTPDHLCGPYDRTNYGGAWSSIAKGVQGKVKIFYSPDGRKPRQVKGAVPAQVIKKWLKTCPVR